MENIGKELFYGEMLARSGEHIGILFLKFKKTKHSKESAVFHYIVNGIKIVS